MLSTRIVQHMQQGMLQHRVRYQDNVLSLYQCMCYTIVGEKSACTMQRYFSRRRTGWMPCVSKDNELIGITSCNCLAVVAWVRFTLQKIHVSGNRWLSRWYGMRQPFLQKRVGKRTLFSSAK